MALCQVGPGLMGQDDQLLPQEDIPKGPRASQERLQHLPTRSLAKMVFAGGKRSEHSDYSPASWMETISIPRSPEAFVLMKPV